jgi:hypothetical protein
MSAVNFLVVLDDGETYSLSGALVRVTDEQLEEIEDGVKVRHVVDLSDSRVCYDLNPQALAAFLSGPEVD